MICMRCGRAGHMANSCPLPDTRIAAAGAHRQIIPHTQPVRPVSQIGQAFALTAEEAEASDRVITCMCLFIVFLSTSFLNALLHFLVHSIMLHSCHILHIGLELVC